MGSPWGELMRRPGSDRSVCCCICFEWKSLDELIVENSCKVDVCVTCEDGVIVANIEIPCPIHHGTPGGLVPNPSHPATYTLTQEQARELLIDVSVEDFEDGPRCLLDTIAELESYDNRTPRMRGIE